MNNNTNNIFYDLLMAAAPATVMFYIVIFTAIVISVAYAIRLWMVQTATFQMQKDIEEIKNHLVGSRVENVEIERPNLSEYVSEEEIKAARAEEIARLKPRKAFVWIACAIPLLLIALVILS